MYPGLAAAAAAASRLSQGEGANSPKGNAYEGLLQKAQAAGATVRRKPAVGVGRYNKAGDWKPAPPAGEPTGAAGPAEVSAPPTGAPPAWQALRERGISGQGSAAANKATLAAQTTPQPPADIGPGENRPFTPPAGEILSAQPAPLSGGRTASTLPLPMRSLRVGGVPTGDTGNAPPVPPEVLQRLMALRSLRGVGAPAGAPGIAAPAPGVPDVDGPSMLKPFETGSGMGGGGMQSIAPETPQGPPSGAGTPFYGPHPGSLAPPPGAPPFATEDTPPWAGLASLMAKPRFQPGGVQQGAPAEPPQGAPGAPNPLRPRPLRNTGMGPGTDTAY